MDKFEYILKDDLDKALEKEYRQYLTGHLSKPQVYLQHIDDDLEVGISFYRNFTADTPHMHPVATEHCYVLSGSVRLRLLDGSNKEYQFDEGDFFMLRPNVGYASKNAAGTKVMFVKNPAGNDKVIISYDVATEKWLKSWN